MSAHHEVERAWALDATDVLPDLSALPGVASVGEPRTDTLAATYLDTDDLALVRGGVTLRRRTGGLDEGWHLKVPAGDGRDELRRALGSAQRVPAPLARAVTAWSHGRSLAPVATVETVRTTRLLLDAAGETLAEVADDAVVGTPADGRPGSSWREVEVELVGAGPALLDAAEELLAEAGIHPAQEQRKIGTVLAERLAAHPAAPRPGSDDADRTAGEVLHGRLAELVGELRHRDCDVRRGVDDGVHQLRVTCRRLRGALATYRPVVDRTVTDPLRDELRWLARTLGDGRDAEVMHERLRELVDELPRGLVVGPVRRRIDRTYAERLRAADGHAQAVLDSPRYLRLLRRLAALEARPPFTDAAEAPAAEVLLDRVARDWRRLRQRVDLVVALQDVRAAGPAGSGGAAASADEAIDEALHDVRKAAKRARYACEALEPGWGGDAKRLRKAAQDVTQVLGDRNDSAVARVELLRIARAAATDGENAFTYGVLHAREAARGETLEAEFGEVWQRVRKARLRAWLR
ncbi:CYTH and CHAD domain-containing protein [Nocardioides litoris]|uniref:CYTH and CHAD domain-containing protein n=1 Tax=Nocardioides litoris TaxID=1926648 RepID=UPI00111FA84B|nr:CYTH and CHAD domain-containing protein [Nocardioides litoris]